MSEILLDVKISASIIRSGGTRWTTSASTSTRGNAGLVGVQSAAGNPPSGARFWCLIPHNTPGRGPLQGEYFACSLPGCTPAQVDPDHFRPVLPAWTRARPSTDHLLPIINRLAKEESKRQGADLERGGGVGSGAQRLPFTKLDGGGIDAPPRIQLIVCDSRFLLLTCRSRRRFSTCSGDGVKKVRDRPITISPRLSVVRHQQTYHRCTWEDRGNLPVQELFANWSIHTRRCCRHSLLLPSTITTEGKHSAYGTCPAQSPRVWLPVSPTALDGWRNLPTGDAGARMEQTTRSPAILG